MKLSHKLFLSLLLCCALATGALLSMMYWNLGSGLAAYLQARDKQTLASLAPTFEQLYVQYNGWSGLRPEPRLSSAENPPHETPVNPPYVPTSPVIFLGALQQAPSSPPPRGGPGFGPEGNRDGRRPPPPGFRPEDRPDWQPGMRNDATRNDTTRNNTTRNNLPADSNTQNSNTQNNSTPAQETSGESTFSPMPANAGTPAVIPAAITPDSEPAISTDGAPRSAQNNANRPATTLPTALGSATENTLPPPHSPLFSTPAHLQLLQMAPELPSLGDRFSVYDDQQRLVVGRHPFGENTLLQELHHNNRLIGWIALYPDAPGALPFAERAFLEQQRNSLWLSGILILILSAGAAALLSGHLARGIQELLRGHAELRNGHFSVRLPVATHDELGKLAQDFNAMAQALEKSEKSRQQWVADIAHELRTPLTILRAEIESVQDGIYELNRQRIDHFHHDILQLSRLVDDLHQLAMADMGMQHLHTTTLSPDNLFATVASSFSARLGDKGLALECHWQASHAQLQGDAQKLSQLLGNILENACRYTDAPGQVRISSHASYRSYELIIEDSAPGVPDWALPRLFERLFRIDKSRSRQHGGSGLGLAIVQAIVQAHHGRITARHSALGGLAVHIELPLQKRHIAAQETTV